MSNKGLLHGRVVEETIDGVTKVAEHWTPTEDAKESGRRVQAFACSSEGVLRETERVPTREEILGLIEAGKRPSLNVTDPGVVDRSVVTPAKENVNTIG